MKNKIRWIPPILWGILIAVLSLIPGGAGNFQLFGIPHFDKIGHFGMYGVWTFLFVFALSDRSGTSGNKPMWTSIIIGSITGVVLELGQYFMMLGRSFEIWDMVANTCGAFAGAWLGRLFYHLNDRSAPLK